jgi:hypothetical protein
MGPKVFLNKKRGNKSSQVRVDARYFVRMHGQSNSEGINLVADLDSELLREFSNVYIWYNPTETDGGGSWQKLQAGVNNQRASRLIYAGAEIWMADLFETNHPNEVLYISKFSVGSTSVATQVGSDWNSASTGESLDIAVDYYDVPALDYLETTMGYTINDLGMIWMQGEQDASHVTNSATATFRSNTAAMFSEYRTRLDISTLPIYVCRLNAAIDRDPTQLANVRTAQGTSSPNLCHSGTYPYNHHFDTDAYPLISGDTVHFEQQPYAEDLYDLFFP